MGRKLLVGSIIVAVAGAVAALIGVPACNVDVPYFCCTYQEACDRHEGGGTITGCLPRYPDRPYCDNDHEYPASDGLGRTCIADPHAELGTICVSAADCTDPAHSACIDQHCQGCGGASDCTAAAPVCSDAHACVGCTQEAECSSYASTPHCGADGTCVACRDSGDCTDPSAPACDPGSSTCRACRADAECPSEICDEDAGTCVPENQVVYVDSATGVLSGQCTKEAPCKTIQLGVDAVSGTRSRVHVAPGTYADPVVISGKSLRISAYGAVLSPLAGPGIDVKGASNVLLEGVQVRNVGGGSNGIGIRCTDDGGKPSLTLVGVTVEKSSAFGVSANGCTLTLSGGSLVDNHEGGVRLSSSDFSIINNVIIKNGTPSSGFGGVFVIDSPPSGTSGAKFEFNTVSENIAQSSASGVICSSAVTVPLSFKNSIVFGNIGSGGQVDGNNCSWVYSDIGPGVSIVSGTGNINAAPVFVNSLMNDYHLQPGSPGINAADPAATVNVDIDGDSRPVGGRSDMGADEVLQ
jgi:hypothetical protein